jgi:hypothetical protein
VPSAYLVQRWQERSSYIAGVLFVGVCAAYAGVCSWLFHCHLTDHIHGGMMALFNIAGQAPVQKLDGKV